MRIVLEQPPLIDSEGNIFRLPEGKIMTFGDVIYNPSAVPIDSGMLKHEECHSRHQGENPDRWWKLYITNTAFRLCEELLAYQEQYLEMKKFIKDKNNLHIYAMKLAENLSKEINVKPFVLSVKEALHLITLRKR